MNVSTAAQRQPNRTRGPTTAAKVVIDAVERCGEVQEAEQSNLPSTVSAAFSISDHTRSKAVSFECFFPISGLVTRHQIVGKQILIQLLSYDTFDDF